METVYNWLQGLLVNPSVLQAIVVLTLVSAVGLLLGKVEIGKVSLGITFVFFLGIVYSYVGYKWFPGFDLNADAVGFARDFGLVLFIYALGLEVGPSFFPSLKKGGITYNLLGVALSVLTLLVCILLYFIPGINLGMPEIIGLMSGAVTNTPVLGAAQTTIQQALPASAEVNATLAAMAQNCAIAYPMGVVGVILTLMLMAAVAGKAIDKRKGRDADSAHAAYAAEFEVCNPALDGKNIREVVSLSHQHFVISRIWRGEDILVPKADTVILRGDKLLTVSPEGELPTLEALFGRRICDRDWNRPDIDWDKVDRRFISRRIVVTRSGLNGTRLGTLRLRNDYGINITRINRAGVELLPDPALRLQLGDRITVVGESESVSKVSDILGDQIKWLDKPNLISFFTGILCGCLLGMVPFFIPGMSLPVKLGLAGGPIVVGILMGAFGPRFHLTTYITGSANLMMKQIGIVLYLAGLGLLSGRGFFDMLLTSAGALRLLLGTLITIVPAVLVGIASMRFFKIDFATAGGMVCGSMANPMALDYAGTLSGNDRPSVVYATVYPFCMFFRIITAQILVLMFL